MTARSVLMFASVYWDDPVANPQQIARQLARQRTVLYVEPSPCSVYLRDVAQNARWLRAGHARRQVAESLHVYSPPPMLPLKTRLPLCNRLSQIWVRPFVRSALRSIGASRPVLFTYLPHLHASIGAYDERLVCYYCVDDMGALNPISLPDVVSGYERRLMARTDLVFTTARGLQQRLSRWHPAVHLVPNGCDPALYAPALEPATPVASEIASLSPPVIGVSGCVDFRIDQPLIEQAARERPGWSFVFVGPVRTSVARLSALPNVRFLGSRPQSALASVLKGFTVSLIPYAMGPMVRYIYPTKLNDYLAAGLPVVSTPLPELADCPADILTTVTSARDLIDAVERLHPTRHDPDLVARRVGVATSHSWERRAAVIEEHISSRLRNRLDPEARCVS